MEQPKGFSVIRRNYGHWDICGEGRRLFRLRGGPGKWWVADERAGPCPTLTFKEQGAAMAFICAELMHELLLAEGQQAHIIEGWNV